MPDTTPVYGLPFYITATDPPDLGQATEDLALAVEGELQRIDGDIATLNALSVASAVENTAQAPYTGTAFTAGTQVCAVAFTAPDSGEVRVDWKSYFQAAIQDKMAFVSCEVRTGSTIGAGTPLANGAANSNDAIAIAGPVVTGVPVRLKGSTFRRVTGLTPGAAYHVRIMYQTETSGSITVFTREVMVTPQL
jgi:hypothetical protein